MATICEQKYSPATENREAKGEEVRWAGHRQRGLLSPVRTETGERATETVNPAARSPKNALEVAIEKVARLEGLNDSTTFPA